MMVRPKPTRPPPVMPPSSVCVKPNCLLQSPRTPARTEKPMPAAISVRKLAQKRIMCVVETMSRPGTPAAPYDRRRRRKGMSARITLTLPDEVLRRAELLAQRTGRSVDEVLADGLRSALMPLGEPVADESAVMAWTDEEVLAAADGT